MSDDSNRESPRNNNCSGVSQHQSISDVVLSEGKLCLDIDYKAVVKELKEREEVLLKEKEEIVNSLRERNDILEADLGDWKIKYCVMEEECCRLKRDLYEKDDLVRELKRDITRAKGKEESYIKRYNSLEGEVQKLEEGKRELDRKLLELGFEKEVEMNEIVERKNAEFKAQLAVLEGCREKIKDKDRLVEYYKLKVEKMELCKEQEDKQRQLKDLLKARWDEFQGMRGSNPHLEECKAEYDARVEELKKSNEEKDEKIKKLLDKVDKLQGEKIEIKKENDDLVDKLQREKIKIEKERYEDIIKLKIEKEDLGKKNMMLKANLVLVNELVSKLEGDMFTFMCKDLERDANFANAPVGKVFSGIIKALDAGMAKDGIHQEADAAFVARITEPKCSLKPGKQSLAAAERLKRKLDFETETSRDDVGSGSKRPTSADPIIIDSDDENGVKDKGRCPGSLLEQRRHQLHKMKKLNNVMCEQSKQEPTNAVLSASRSDHALNTSQEQKLASPKKYKQKHRRGDMVALSRFSNGNDSNYNHGTPKSNNWLCPQAKELLTYLRQRIPYKLEYDIVYAFEQDDDLCAKAVCALYWLKMSVLSKGLEECDISSVSALAKLLIDGDPSGQMKKSVDQVQQEDLAECRRLAVKYSEQFFNIFSKKNKDPQFSPVSN
ncbi:myosin-7B-like [Chenopodium quinoa]|uniref:myosin-7B-like n=1 Tax=Chenopodium quinoa TaxID=63459 RepID=UPI000B77F122|nr:myosin-7B-like [Chenopodium quinoa]